MAKETKKGERARLIHEIEALRRQSFIEEKKMDGLFERETHGRQVWVRISHGRRL